VSATEGARETAPCGCTMETIGDTFVLTACAAGEACLVVQYAQAAAARQGKPSEVVAIPEDARGLV